MAGRKPLPTNVKIFRGNPGHYPLNEYEPRPPTKMPICPDHLQGRAREEWRRISKQLHRIGLLTIIDGAALAGYCEAYGRWADATEQVAKFGMVIKSPNGYPMLSPFLSIINAALAQMKGFLTEFGMTPSSRSRISTGKLEEEGDESKRFFG
jgi:P27 family predicted phage terminase small subunit